MILERLKQETHDLHLATEAAMPFGDPAFDKNAYIALLQRTYGFFKTWEAAALLYAEGTIAGLVRERSRLNTLTKDLAFFHRTEYMDGMPPGYLPPMRDQASLLGSMYVVEGSTLGGQLIARMLEVRLSLTNGSGYSFFAGAGPQTGKRWKAFGEVLTAWSSEHASETDLIIAAARKTFEAYRSWVGNTARREEVLQ